MTSFASENAVNTLLKIPVIPDQVLESHICRLCGKYLTVSPITVHPDGGNICGRCHHEVNKPQSLFECESVADLIEQVNIPYAIFGYVNHLFPCINRYEGCTKLLAFGDIGNHEITCRSKKIHCRYCGYEGTGSQQVIHFKSVHPLHFFQTVRFRFPLQRICSNLIKRGENLFVLDGEFDEERRQVRFYLKSTKSLEDEIDFFCLLKDIYGEVIDQTTLSRRGLDSIYHSIFIKDKYFLDEDINMFYCECLLKRVTNKVQK